MLVPTLHSLRVNIQTIGCHEHMEYMMHSSCTLDITRVVPTTIHGLGVVSFSIEDAVTKLTNAIDSITWNLVPLHVFPSDIAIDWNTTPTTWYMLNLYGNHIYMMSQIPLSKNKPPELEPSSLLAYMQYCTRHVHNVVTILLNAKLPM